MDSKERHTWSEYQRITPSDSEIAFLGDDTLVVKDFDKYPQTSSLVATASVDGTDRSYQLETRAGDTIWCVPPGEAGVSHFYYGVPLKPEIMQFQILNEIAGGFVNNFVSSQKHKIFFVFSNASSTLYKTSLITHSVPLPRYQQIFGQAFSADMASNQQDLVASVLVNKIVYGQDANNNSFLIDPEKKSVQRVDWEWAFQGRDGNSLDMSVKLKIPADKIFGSDLNTECLTAVSKRLLCLADDPKKLKKRLGSCISQLLSVPQLKNKKEQFLQSARNLVEAYGKRVNKDFIGKCERQVVLDSHEIIFLPQNN